MPRRISIISPRSLGPICKLLYKMGQDFLDIQYVMNNRWVEYFRSTEFFNQTYWYYGPDLTEARAGAPLVNFCQNIMVISMVLILDGNSEYVAEKNKNLIFYGFCPLLKTTHTRKLRMSLWNLFHSKYVIYTLMILSHHFWDTQYKNNINCFSFYYYFLLFFSFSHLKGWVSK